MENLEVQNFYGGRRLNNGIHIQWCKVTTRSIEHYLCLWFIYGMYVKTICDSLCEKVPTLDDVFCKSLFFCLFTFSKRLWEKVQKTQKRLYEDARKTLERRFFVIS